MTVMILYHFVITYLQRNFTSTCADVARPDCFWTSNIVWKINAWSVLILTLIFSSVPCAENSVPMPIYIPPRKTDQGHRALPQCWINIMRPRHIYAYPANARQSTNVGTMLGQRRRRWANIVPALGESLIPVLVKLWTARRWLMVI